MRDLYQRLGVSPKASDEELQRAVALCPNRALRQDAEAVFGVANHRESYHQSLETLNNIGQLRARLGLTHGAHWQGDVANDFSRPADQSVSRHDELVDRVSHAVVLYDRLRGRRGIGLLIAAFSAGTGIGIAIGVALSRTLAA